MSTRIAGRGSPDGGIVALSIKIAVCATAENDSGIGIGSVTALAEL